MDLFGDPLVPAVLEYQLMIPWYSNYSAINSGSPPGLVLDLPRRHRTVRLIAIASGGLLDKRCVFDSRSLVSGD